MGLRFSKSKKNSYDIAPVVSKEDFTYEKVVNKNEKVTESVKVDATLVEETVNADGNVKVTEVVVEENKDGNVKVTELVVEEKADGNVNVTELVVEENKDDNVKVTEVVVEEKADGDVKVTELVAEDNKDGNVNVTEVVVEEKLDGTVKVTKLVAEDNKDGNVNATELVAEKNSDGNANVTELEFKEYVDGDVNVNVTELVIEKKEDVTVPSEIAVESIVPKWLTEKVFLDMLQESVEDFVQVKNLQAKPALGAGENYGALILRIKIDVEVKDNKTKQLSYILKVPHDTPKMQELLAFNNFFNTENAFYFDILPQLEQAYKAKGVEFVYGPKAYRLTGDEHAANTVLLEDLGQFGFKNTNRWECLDEQHAKRVLKKMAQFHAASAYVYATKGPFADVFMRGLLDKNDPNARIIFESMIGSFQKMFLANLNQYEDGESYYKPKFETVFDHMLEEFVRLFDYDPNDFCVLNHGDCWSNNILFKYDDEQTVADLRFVDFQQPKFGSPAQDLLYFIISSLKKEIKLKKFDYFIGYYHENLIEQLKLLEYPKRLPTLREIHMEIINYSVWCITTMVITLPIVLAVPTKSATNDNFMSEHEDALQFKNTLYLNESYREQVKELLPWLDNRGFLDV